MFSHENKGSKESSRARQASCVSDSISETSPNGTKMALRLHCQAISNWIHFHVVVYKPTCLLVRAESGFRKRDLT